MTKRLFSLLTLAATVSPFISAQSDSKVDYADRQYLGNIQAGSNNPSALHFMPITDLADIHVEYRHTGGKFHLIDEGNRLNSWIASFSGMKRIDKVTFAGSLVYDNTSESERSWNNTLFVSDRNPFIIGDSLKSKFSTETFHLDGSAAYRPSENLLLGLGAVYNVGSSATQKDPRPEIKGMRFRLTPGVEYSFGAHTLGLSGDVEWLSEEVQHTVVRTTTKQYVFLFQGLGVFEAKDAIGYRRKFNGTHWGAQVQYAINPTQEAKVSNFIQVAYFGEYEDAVDGSGNSRYKGGRYSGSGFSISERFRLRVSPYTVHNFSLEADMADSKGKWYTQRSQTDADGNLIYEVINESDNFTGNFTSATLRYDFNRLNEAGIPLWQARAAAGLNQSVSKNKLYAAKESYTNFTCSAGATKRFPIKKGWLAANIDAAFMMNLEKSLKISEMPETYSKIMALYTRPAYNAASTGYWQAGLGLTYSLPVRILGYASLLEISAEGDFRNATKKVNLLGSDRFYAGGKVGFIF